MYLVGLTWLVLTSSLISDKDIELIWSNAKTYYDTSDKEYIDGCAIWAVFKKTVAKISDKEKDEEKQESEEEDEDQEEEASEESEEEVKPTRKSSGRGASTGGGNGRGRPRATRSAPEEVKTTDENDYVIADLDDPFSVLFDNIVLMTDSDGDPICGPFLTLPSKKEYPDYYDDIEKPIALDKIRTKVIKGKYRNLHQMEEDIVLMCNNAREYNVEGSQIYNDATAIMRFTRQKRIDIEAQFPDVQDDDETKPEVEPPVAKIKKERKRNPTEEQSPQRGPGLGNRIQRGVYRAITSAKDNTGRQLASIFFVKPDADQYPDYYEVIQEPIDLKTIDHKITKNHYKSIDDMMKDVFLMFKNAKAGFLN